MIYGIMGWTMIGLGCNHSVHLIRKTMVPDNEESRTLAILRDRLSMPRLIRGNVRVKEENQEVQNANYYPTRF